MAQTVVFPITGLVGNEPEQQARAESLASIIQRTVEPEKWIALGGLNTIHPFYNNVKEQWYLVAFTDIPSATIQTVLTSLNT